MGSVLPEEVLCKVCGGVIRITSDLNDICKKHAECNCKKFEIIYVNESFGGD